MFGKFVHPGLGCGMGDRQKQTLSPFHRPTDLQSTHEGIECIYFCIPFESGPLPRAELNVCQRLHCTSQLYCGLVDCFNAGDTSQGLVLYSSFTASALTVVVLESHSATTIKVKVTLSTYTSCRNIGDVKANVHSFLISALEASG
jgi:hypothetical protein